MDRAAALGKLGLGAQDWGPCYSAEFTYEEFAANWRGAVPCPTEAELIAADASATTERDVEIKRKLLAEAMLKRDALLGHLERLRTRAIEANNTTARNALSTAITSFEGIFNDPRVVSAIDGEVKPVLKTINREIGLTLGAASPASLQALLALDAL
jgi:hypothetical protein